MKEQIEELIRDYQTEVEALEHSMKEVDQINKSYYNGRISSLLYVIQDLKRITKNTLKP